MPPLINMPFASTSWIAPRELADVEPTLRFACNGSQWARIKDLVDEFWWSVRYRRAAAWDGDISLVITLEHQMQSYADALVSRLAPLDVSENAVRAWLDAYRRKTDAREQQRYDATEEETSEEWLTYSLPPVRD